MNDQLIQLSERIRNELAELQRVLQRAEEGWQRAQSFADDFYLDGVTLNLHGFYNGLERIFERIAAVLDGAKPTGENWHRALLEQMSKEVPGVRPAIISEITHAQLDEYRGFRHVARHVYTFNVDPAKIGQLIVGAPPLFTHVTQ